MKELEHLLSLGPPWRPGGRRLDDSAEEGSSGSNGGDGDRLGAASPTFVSSQEAAWDREQEQEVALFGGSQEELDSPPKDNGGGGGGRDKKAGKSLQSLSRGDGWHHNSQVFVFDTLL